MRWTLQRRCLAALALAFAAMPSRATTSTPPTPGQTFTQSIVLGVGKLLPLPPGLWRVEAAFVEPMDLRGEGGRRGQATQVIVVANENRFGADLQVLVYEVTSGANTMWSAQPCNALPANARPLLSKTFGTTSASMRVRCNGVWDFYDLSGAVRQGVAHPDSWTAKRLGVLQSRAGSLPFHALVGTGYLTAKAGDRVAVWAYIKPGQYGLGGVPGGPSPFRLLDSAGPWAPMLRGYLKAFAEWFDDFTHAVDNAYLGGSSPGSQAVPAFRFDALAAVGAASSPASGASAVAAATVPAAAPIVPTLPAGPARQSVHALVIGNGAYSGARLLNPRNDALAVAERFRRFGFTVTTLLDATRRQLVDALVRFTDSARAADVSIVFYAGHGLQIDGVNYLIPVDLDLGATPRALGITYEAVSLNTLLEQHLPGKAKLVFIDACRDNPLARSLVRTRGGAGQGLAPVNAASGTLISYATRDGSTAADGSGANSPYTAALLAHLDEAEDISIVLRRVRQRVMTSTGGAQEPWEYGSLVGDKLVLSQIAQRR